MNGQSTQLTHDGLIYTITNWLQNTLSNWGIAEQWIVYTKLIILLMVVVIGVYILQLIVAAVLKFVFRRIRNITKIDFFEFTTKNRLPHYLALTIPYSFVREAIPIVFVDFSSFINPLIKLTDIYIVFMVIWAIMSVLRSFGDVLLTRPAFKDKPMKSYLQVVQIILYIFGAVVIYCIITGKSPTAFFAAMGAASAILMLMFKDTIMGFVSSIQLSSNDMLKTGDWITMSKFGADGNVEEINLTTVKIRNFDNTITTIPTYALISDSFKNWRCMQDVGGRRFKRCLLIKQSSIHFCDENELEKYKQIEGLVPSIEAREGNEVTQVWHEALSSHTRQLTNNDLFMQYGVSYLRNHPLINQTMTVMVRQQSPTPQGLPVEVYAFTKATGAVDFEAAVSEVINHLVSVVKHFDLIIFEDSSGSDDYNVYLKNQRE